MNTKEKLTRRIIELIHGLPYEEAVEKFYTSQVSCPDNVVGCLVLHKGTILPPITIGRVIQAFYNKAQIECSKYDGEGACDCWYTLYTKVISRLTEGDWKLTKENGQECTLDDQTEETMKKLYQLIK